LNLNARLSINRTDQTEQNLARLTGGEVDQQEPGT